MGSAFVLGFFYMIVLRLCGGPIIYLSIVAILGGLGYGSYMLIDFSKQMADTEEYKLYYLYGGYAVAGFGGLILLCALCQCKNIRIGVAVMKCTAAFIGGTPQVFLVPPITSIFILGWLALWVIIGVSIYSVGEIKPNP
jgi:hypothetical protein